MRFCLCAASTKSRSLKLLSSPLTHFPFLIPQCWPLHLFLFFLFGVCEFQESVMSGARLIQRFENPPQPPTPILGEASQPGTLTRKLSLCVCGITKQTNPCLIFLQCLPRWCCASSLLLTLPLVSQRLLSPRAEWQQSGSSAGRMIVSLFGRQVPSTCTSVLGSPTSPSTWLWWASSRWCWHCSPACPAPVRTGTSRPTPSAASVCFGTCSRPPSCSAGLSPVSFNSLTELTQQQ